MKVLKKILFFALICCLICVFFACNIKDDNIQDNSDDKYTEGLEYTLSDDETYYIVSGIGTCKDTPDIVIPSTYNGKPVASIGAEAFSYCSRLTSVTVPDGVTSIGIGAFSYCSSLTSVAIPDSVTSIGIGAFSNSRCLTSVTIPDGVTSIGDETFSQCSRLTSVTISDSVTSIGSDAFEQTGYYNNDSNWENGVLYIGKYLIKAKDISGSYSIRSGTRMITPSAFSYCYSLTSVTIPDSVTSIGDRAFSYCSSLSSVTIPDSVTSIGNEAFYSCSNLTSVTIPDSVASIGSLAFFGCTNLTSVTIGNGVASIGDMAFYSCSSLKSVTFKDTENWKADSLWISSGDLADPSTAAMYLRFDYSYYTWKKG